MNAPIRTPAVTELPPRIFDFATCPEPLDARGHATWARILALQAHVQITQLRVRIHELAIEEYCDTCGAQPCVPPCVDPGFCTAGWREAALDCHANRSVIKSNSRPHKLRPTPQATVDAVMYCVRERGVAVLKEPANVERLSRCDAAAKAEIDKRIAKLIAAKVING